MDNLLKIDDDKLTQILTYAGFILVAYELVKSLIVRPIKLFYLNTTFGEGIPFKSYEEDVLSLHKNEFEACLYYLRDFMEAINSEDVLTIQSLRKHRNDLTHELPERLKNINIANYIPLLEKTIKVLFKLSNYRTRMEIGADPEFKNIDWNNIAGEEYFVLIEILDKIKIFEKNIL
jgi:hypothetical protein